MSQFFEDAAGVTLWNPANRVAGLFMRTTEAVGGLVSLPSGVGAMVSDECVIDVDVFVVFVEALVREYRSSGHPVFRSLLEGWLATAVVMVWRAGRELPALDDRLAESARAQAAGMPV
nr:DUF6086 family protein [Actinoplanes derwentensis]